MARAVWNGVVIAEASTDEIQTVKGNVFVVSGKINRDAAWYYPDPKEAAKEIGGYLAFWRGIVVER